MDKKNGRPIPIKGQLPSPQAYLVDSIKISELPAYENKILLHQKYVAEGLSAKAIADLLGCSITTVKAKLREFGLSKKGLGVAVHRENLAFGKRLVGSKAVAHKAESQVIETIRKMYHEQGIGPTAIANLLDTMKVPTKRQGKKWDHSMVIGLLKREGVYKQTRKSPQKRGKK